MFKSQWALGLAGLVAFTFFSSIYTLPEGRQAFVTQFGKISSDPVTEAGLHFKWPFIQDVRIFDKRILQWDGDAEQIPTKDKKYIWVDTTARWRINNVIRFAQTVQNERTAANRLDGILDGITRDTISSYNLVETVRNTNAILDSRRAGAAAAMTSDGTAEDQENGAGERGAGHSIANSVSLAEEAMSDDITGEVEEISIGREALTKEIISRARIALDDIGVELLDVQLRRVSYEESVEQKVYERMITERQKIAARIRSFGQGEAAKISGRLNLKLKEIESEAYRQAQELKGDAEATAIRNYAVSLSKDPEFYEFLETLDTYKSTLKDNTHFVFSSDAPYLRGLSGP